MGTLKGSYALPRWCAAGGAGGLPTRYPGDAENPSAEESQVALAIAREIVEAILARLPPDVRA